MITVPKQNKGFLKLLLYYRQEEACPFPETEARSTYWTLEQLWVTQVVNVNETLDGECMTQFMFDFPSWLLDITARTNTPTSLVAFMYDQYGRQGGTREDFPAWLLEYTMSAI